MSDSQSRWLFFGSLDLEIHHEGQSSLKMWICKSLGYIVTGLILPWQPWLQEARRLISSGAGKTRMATRYQHQYWIIWVLADNLLEHLLCPPLPTTTLLYWRRLPLMKCWCLLPTGQVCLSVWTWLSALSDHHGPKIQWLQWNPLFSVSSCHSLDNANANISLLFSILL